MLLIDIATIITKVYVGRMSSIRRSMRFFCLSHGARQGSYFKKMILSVVIILIVVFSEVFIFRLSQFYRIIRLPSVRTLSKRMKPLVTRDISQEPIYSTFRCIGDENNIDAFADRLCIFHSLCYNTDQDRFEYYRRYRRPKLPIFFDSIRGMLTEFSLNNDGHGFIALQSRGRESWAPYIVESSYPSAKPNVTWLWDLHTLWQVNYNVINSIEL